MHTNKLRFVDQDEQDGENRKIQLRVYMKKRRADNENRDAKERLLIENTLAVLTQIERAGTQRKVFCYLSYSSEAPTDGLIESLTENGFAVYAPRIENGDMLAVAVGEDFTLSDLGIREPIGRAYEGEIPFAVAPLLAVDEKGNRLGYGGGYYDRYFANNPRTVRIGYCFDFQLLSCVPSVETDEPLDWVVTDKRIIKTGRR